MPRRLILILGLVGLQALALVVVLGITYWASQGVLLRFAEGLTARIARDTTAYTENFLDPAEDAAQLSQRLLEAGVVPHDDTEALGRYLFDVLQTRDSFDGAYFGAASGDFVYVSRDTTEPRANFRVKTIETGPDREVVLSWRSERFREVAAQDEPDDDYDPRNRPWYRAALDANAVSWTSPYIFFSSQRPGVTVSMPVADPLSGGVLGAVGVDIGIESLSTFLGGLEISANGSAAIVAETGDIVAHSEEDFVAEADPDGTVRFNTVDGAVDPLLMQAAASISGGLGDLFPGEIRVSHFRADGQAWLAAVQRLRLEATPWTVVTWLPESDILEPLHQVRTIAVWVTLAALAATALLGLFYGRILMRPDQGQGADTRQK